MGEIAEMMLDGTLCAGCGEFIGSDAGYAQYCSPQCQRASEPKTSTKPKFECRQCKKQFRSTIGVRQHEHDKHGIGGKADRL